MTHPAVCRRVPDLSGRLHGCTISEFLRPFGVGRGYGLTEVESEASSQERILRLGHQIVWIELIKMSQMWPT